MDYDKPIKEKSWYVRGEYLTAGLIGVLIITIFGGGIFLFHSLGPSSNSETIPTPSEADVLGAQTKTPVPVDNVPTDPAAAVNPVAPVIPPKPTVKPSPSKSPNPTPTASPSPTPSPTPSPSPTESPSPSPTNTASPTPSPSPTPTVTPSPSPTPSPT